VIAIAASAETAAARVDIAHAMAIKATLIVFGLATSIPLIIAGSAILMAILQRYPILVWAGGALLGWVAGDIMAKDSAIEGLFSPVVLVQLHYWAAAAGAIFVIGAGYLLVRSRRAAEENV
jgi:predicted tellurium resistance membrane protein TerC